MTFDVRKSPSSEPTRFNLKKSGFDHSIGIQDTPGNTGSQGTYVTINANGIHYKQQTQTNTSDLTTKLTNVDSLAFVNELTTKTNKLSYFKWFGLLPLITFLILLPKLSFESIETITQQATDQEVAKIDSRVGSYIRAAPDAHSAVLKTAHKDETFPLLQSTNSKWLKIQIGDTVGYVTKKLASTSTIHKQQLSSIEWRLTNPYFVHEFIIGIPLFILLLIWLYKKDKQRFAMELYYEMDDQMASIYEQAENRFSDFNKCARKWQYLRNQSNDDWKRNAGADTLVSRTPVIRVSAHKAPNRFLKTNVRIPYIRLRGTELFFLPERLLVRKGRKFAAVFYKNLEILSDNSKFIETGSIPSDAKVIDHTWKYQNKNGSPDMRFKDNTRLSVCLYTEYVIKSKTGIYEIIATSRAGGFDAFTAYVRHIGALQTKMTAGIAIR